MGRSKLALIISATLFAGSLVFSANSSTRQIQPAVLEITPNEGEMIIGRVAAPLPEGARKLVMQLCRQENIVGAALFRYADGSHEVLAECGQTLEPPTGDLALECLEDELMVSCPVVSTFLGTLQIQFAQQADVEEAEAARNLISSSLFSQRGY
jgi:hypothetical protein